MVFKTIAENVRSFFHTEEELERQPKKPKDAAVEVLEKPGADHHIVAHKLGNAPLPQEQPRPKLPFSSEQLKQRLAQQQTSQPSQAPLRTQRPQITDEDISSQIVEFEQAINTIPGEDGSTLPISVPSKVAVNLAKRELPHDGYFDHFAQFLRQQGYDVDDALLAEALSKMKQHHEHRIIVEKHKERAQSLEEQLSHKLAELRELEREWASRQEDIAIAKERTMDLEEAIAKRTTDLRQLVATMREHINQVPPPTPPLPEAQPRPGFSPPEPSPSPSSSLPLVTEGEPTSVSQTLPPALSAIMTPPPSPPLPPQSPLTSFPSVPSPPPSLSRPSLLSSTPMLPPEKRFFLHDGKILGSLAELRDELRVMDDALFYYHATPARNDFADWICGVFGDERLAERVLHANNKYDVARLLSQ